MIHQLFESCQKNLGPVVGCGRFRMGARFMATENAWLPPRRSIGWIHSLERLQKPEESRSLPDVGELDAECLHLNEQILNIDNLVADERL